MPSGGLVRWRYPVRLDRGLMLTTILNPALWLLAALAASAVAARIRGESARTAFSRIRDGATRVPVLIVLGLAVLGGLGSRIVVGYLAPGSYAEEVLAARSFLSARQTYRGDDRRDFSKWLAEEPAPITPWTLPGVEPCQASALESRPQFYTAQGHSPALLMASVPFVALGGGHTLYVVFVLLSLVALAGMALAFSVEAGLRPWSASTLVLIAALVGWQPSLAGVRQGDAVIVVSGLVVWSWRLLRNGDDLKAGVAAGLAGALLLPALVFLVPIGLRSRRALAAGLAIFALAVVATLAVAGPLLFIDYAASTMASARLYDASPMAYSVLGQVLRLDPQRAAPVAWTGILLLAVTTAAALGQWTAAAREEPQSRPLGAGQFDATAALLATLAFLLVPVAWSQHVTLLAIPIAVLLGRVVSLNQPAGLAVLAGLVALLSLPDQAVGQLGIILKLSGSAGGITGLPPVPVWAAFGLWVWLLAAHLGPARFAWSNRGG